MKKLSKDNFEVNESDIVMTSKGFGLVVDDRAPLFPTIDLIESGEQVSVAYIDVIKQLIIGNTTLVASYRDGRFNILIKDQVIVVSKPLLKYKKAFKLAVKQYQDVNLQLVPTQPPVESAETSKLPVEITETAEELKNIMGNISEITEGINKNSSLASDKVLMQAFSQVKKTLEAASSPKPKGFLGFFGGSSSKDLTDKSVQDDIEDLFTIIHNEYENLIVVGERLQESKRHLKSQIEALTELKVKSDKYLESFAEADRSMRAIALNTKIKGNILKYKARLQEVEIAIASMQMTIITLGEDLPTKKSDLVDEAAIGVLLDGVSNYQEMYSDINGLVSTVRKTTAEKTYSTVENLYDIQINDTTTQDLIEDTKAHQERFIGMVKDKTKQLNEKTLREAKLIDTHTLGTSIMPLIGSGEYNDS